MKYVDIIVYQHTSLILYPNQVKFYTSYIVYFNSDVKHIVHSQQSNHTLTSRTGDITVIS